MKTHEISRFTGFTTGNQVAITATIDRRFAEEGIRAFMQRKAVPSIYDPEREFKLFTKVVLEPMTVVAVEADLVIPATDSAQTGLEVQSAQTGLKVQGLASFVSYKANLGDVVRSSRPVSSGFLPMKFPRPLGPCKRSSAQFVPSFVMLSMDSTSGPISMGHLGYHTTTSWRS